jgi:phage-related protein
MYVGQDSIEKTRAQADGLNEVMRIMKDAIGDLVSAIKVEESALKGMEASGAAVFNDDGTLSDKSSNEAFITAAKMEELKMGLQGVLAEAEMTDDIAASVNGNMGEILKRLGFASPELQKCNKIIKNINTGLDKNGKALKFQKRTQEILNYSYQLMGRHIGQMFKNWMMMLNPLNGIKRLFSDFASYDVKWQRTMNVIKYNLRRIVRPMMEWIAQTLVNMLGLVNSLMKGIGSVFGKNWDLFDKDAANTEKMREDLEAMQSISAGFDELHDISGESGGPATDFSEDIYTPQWDGLNKVLEDIGKTIGNIVKAVSDWTFWDWLILAGAALAGFIVLKWLIGLFSNKNPLQSVADGFKTLQTTVGWAVLIASFSLFVKVLTDFVDCMKTADWDDIVQSLLLLAGAFASLVLAAGGLMYIGTALNVALPAMLGLSAVVGVFALLIFVLAKFLEITKECTSEEILNSLAALAAGLALIGLVVVALMVALSAIIATGVGAIAIVALAAVLAVVALIITAMAEYVRALGEAGAGIQLICEGIATIVTAIGEQITNYVKTVGETIVQVIGAVSEGIATVLQPILDFIDSIMDKIFSLAEVIAHEIGETIRTVIETTGDVIIGIIEALLNAIPNLLNSILNFINGLGPAINNFVDGFIQAITKMVNFTISAFEYILNLGIDVINGLIEAANKVPGVNISYASKISIPRFVPAYEVGTNYVPNDGLAYLHKGEAVIPKKYNTPYQPGGMSPEEKAYMSQMLVTMRSLDNTMKQGIRVNGQFTQRGSDLVAVVNRTKSQAGADLLSNVAYAR